MPLPSDATAQLLRLQQEVMLELDAIATQIKNGELSEAEGSARARALIQANDARRQALMDAVATQERQRTQRRLRMMAMMAGLLVFALAGVWLSRQLLGGP